MGSSWIQHNFNTISIQKCIVIKPLLMIRDDHQYSEGEWRPCISKTTEHLNTKVINIWTKLVTFSTNQDSGIGDFPGNISLWHTYPVLLGGLLHCEGSLLHIHDINRMSVTPGRSWQLKLYLTPIQDGRFFKNSFSLVPSYIFKLVIRAW